MKCMRWSPHQLLPVAIRLARECLCIRKVHGVALTGSLARLEPLCHDIDLVVLTAEAFPEASCALPDRPSSPAASRYGTARLWPSLGSVVGETVAARLHRIRGNVPGNLIFVQERALWDCGYLQKLNIGESQFPDFYLALLRQSPCVLLFPDRCRGGIAQYLEDATVVPFAIDRVKEPYPAVFLRHRCGDPACMPTMSWPERSKILKARKNHTWHD